MAVFTKENVKQLRTIVKEETQKIVEVETRKIVKEETQKLFEVERKIVREETQQLFEVERKIVREEFEELRTELRHQGILLEATNKKIDTMLEILVATTKKSEKIAPLETKAEWLRDDHLILKHTVKTHIADEKLHSR